MAAATVTRTLAVGGEHRITVTSTGGAGSVSTIALVYAAVFAILPTAMSYDSGTNTYTLHRLLAAYSSLYISANCTVLIPIDFSFVNLGYAANNTGAVFYIYSGGTLRCKPGSRISFSAEGGYLWFYGGILAIGTAAKPVILLKYRLLCVYHNNVNHTSRYEYVTFKNINNSAAYYFLYFSNYQVAISPVIFKNIKFTNDSGLNWGYAFCFNPGLYSNILIDGFLCDHVYTAILTYTATVKLKNGIIKNTGYTYACYIQPGGNNIRTTYLTTKTDTLYPTGSNQPLVWLLNILFDSFVNTGYYAIFSYYGATVYAKNCTFSCTTGSATYRGLYASIASYIILNNNDYTGIASNGSRKVWDGNGTILHGKELDLTVVDNNSMPIQNAAINIYQADHKLNWNFLTDINGKVKNIFGDPIVLINKEEYIINKFNKWCDTADTSSYHYIVTSYPGYVTNITRIDTNIDNTITIQLLPVRLPLTFGDEDMLYSIANYIKTSLLLISDIKYVGYYPNDFQYITNRMPALLIKFGDTQINAMGHRMYLYTYNTLFILYTTDTFEDIENMEAAIMSAVYDTLTDTSGDICLHHLDLFTILAGNINDYISPDSTGYNANITVRKLTLNYTITKYL